MSLPLQRVSLRVPATTANLGPGFDCLGLALQWYNSIEVSELPDGDSEVIVEGRAAPDDLPRGSENLTWRAISRVFALANEPIPPLRVRITIEAPIARGLGSSASAIVGGMAAANLLLGNRIPQDQLVAEMISMEGHPDNIVACFFGGLTASLVTESEVYVRKYFPAENLRCVLVVPDYQLSTARARKVLPRSIPVRDAVFNLARIPFLIDKLCSGDLSGLAVIMDDRLHQPHRRKLIAEYDVVESEAMRAGACAVCISGSGPTMLALATAENATYVAQEVRRTLTQIGKDFLIHVVAPDADGIQADDNRCVVSKGRIAKDS
ncbi:MAG: homoserine kinase [Candidatus Sumerlaeaceae bacterium]|nr:homoserine kinase [Candidatus Sumerlaeaceae bacterium]